MNKTVYSCLLRFFVSFYYYVRLNPDVDHCFVRVTLFRVSRLFSVKCPSDGTLNGAAYKKKNFSTKKTVSRGLEEKWTHTKKTLCLDFEEKWTLKDRQRKFRISNQTFSISICRYIAEINTAVTIINFSQSNFTKFNLQIISKARALIYTYIC